MRQLLAGWGSPLALAAIVAQLLLRRGQRVMLRQSRGGASFAARQELRWQAVRYRCLCPGPAPATGAPT